MINKSESEMNCKSRHKLIHKCQDLDFVRTLVSVEKNLNMIFVQTITNTLRQFSWQVQAVLVHRQNTAAYEYCLVGSLLGSHDDGNWMGVKLSVSLGSAPNF